MPNSDTSSPYQSNDPRLLAEVGRQAESRLHAQLTTALAGDQRALTVAGFLAAAVIASAGGAVSLLSGSSPNTFLALVALMTGLGLLVALALAVVAAHPSSFEVVGSEPENWLDDIRNCRDIDECMAEQAEHYQEMIQQNHLCMRRSARWLVMSIRTGFGSIAAGGLGFAAYVMPLYVPRLTPAEIAAVALSYCGVGALMIGLTRQ